MPCVRLLRCSQISDNAIQQRKVRTTDTGAAVQIVAATLSIGNNDLISNINWNIMPKERWALVGKNGAGMFGLFID